MFRSFTGMQKMQKPVVQMTKQLIMFWSFDKTKMLKRKEKKSQLTVISATKVFFSTTALPIIQASPSTSIDASTDVLDTSLRLPKSADLLTSC